MGKRRKRKSPLSSFSDLCCFHFSDLWHQCGLPQSAGIAHKRFSDHSCLILDLQKRFCDTGIKMVSGTLFNDAYRLFKRKRLLVASLGYQGIENIRDIVAFPKNGSGVDLMMDSPSAVDPAQLAESHLALLPTDD